MHTPGEVIYLPTADVYVEVFSADPDHPCHDLSGNRCIFYGMGKCGISSAQSEYRKATGPCVPPDEGTPAICFKKCPPPLPTLEKVRLKCISPLFREFKVGRYYDAEQIKTSKLYKIRLGYNDCIYLNPEQADQVFEKIIV